jgi:hypothetical protein
MMSKTRTISPLKVYPTVRFISQMKNGMVKTRRMVTLYIIELNRVKYLNFMLLIILICFNYFHIRGSVK